MPRKHAQPSGPLRAFTLVELLVVVAIIAALAGILLPALLAARTGARMAATSSLIRSVAAACHAFEADHGRFPPVTSTIHSDIDKPAESLWFYLTRQTRPGVDNFNPDTYDETDPDTYDWDDPVIYGAQRTGPYFAAQRGQLMDYDNDGVFEIVDVWGTPLLYNPANDGIHGGPHHNRLTFDLFSVGPNGTTRSHEANFMDYEFNQVVEGVITYDAWVQFCLENPGGGNDTTGPGGNAGAAEPDDINNWNTR